MNEKIDRDRSALTHSSDSAENTETYAVLFVCMGNICRSPTADAVFRSMVVEAGLSDRIDIDSAGTHAYHVGDAPDPRSVKTAARAGYDLSALRARQVCPDDFRRFDYIVAMDSDNLERLEAQQPSASTSRLCRLLDFASTIERHGGDVPDPYYQDGDGFEVVLELVEDGCRGLLRDFCSAYALS